MLKCQKCTKPATFHITEVVGEEQFEELHLCDECYLKFYQEPLQQSALQKGGTASSRRAMKPMPSISANARSAASSSSNFAIPAGWAVRTTMRNFATSSPRSWKTSMARLATAGRRRAVCRRTSRRSRS